MAGRPPVGGGPPLGRQSRGAAQDAADAGAPRVDWLWRSSARWSAGQSASGKARERGPRATELRANRQIGRVGMGSAAGLAAGWIVVSWAVRGRPGPASANAAAGDDRRALRC